MNPQAVIITVGTELTDGRITDSNGPFLARDLEGRGVTVARVLSVPDAEGAIGWALTRAVELEPALVVVAGGLGPTADDLTAAALAGALGLETGVVPAAAAMVAAAGGGDSATLGPHQVKQATLPTGSLPLAPVGTAPGFIIFAGAAPVVVLPGVPLEMRQMWAEARSLPPIAGILDAASAPARRRLNFYGAGEPEVNAAVEALRQKYEVELEVSICARRREVLLEVAADHNHQPQVDELIDALMDRFKDTVYSEGDEIEEVVAGRLTGLGRTLAVGESCTGGMLGETVTRVPGASAFFLGGVVAYSNEVKRDLLKVRQETLDNVGAVSEPVAQQLALGVRALTGADYGAGITGVAGPSGGTPEKPVGLVFICVSSEEGDVVRGFNFPGSRDDIREYSVTAALHMLNRKIMDDEAAAAESAE